MNVKLLLCILCAVHACVAQRPNIIVILADDLGWNDIGFHGSDEIPTPNIDALAYSGIILNNYYVMPLCSPSRSALMTGKHPIHTGMQDSVIMGDTPFGLPLSEKLMSQHLNGLGYTSRIVGKWHLGFIEKQYTPVERGFASHFGYWTGHKDYYDHRAFERGLWGYDLRRDASVAWDSFGEYTTDMFTNEAVGIINSHNSSQPLFLYLAHLAVHVANPYTPLQAPIDEVNRFPYIKNKKRRIFAAMASKLDESVGRVVAALHENDMLENTVIVFSTDNGGPAGGYEGNAASNWPLRGIKCTFWEGGTRGAAFIWSPKMKRRGIVSNQMMHIQDWLPTLYGAAGGIPSFLPKMDGMDLWPALNYGGATRSDFVYNIIGDDKAAIRHNDWKIIKGDELGGGFSKWFGPSGRDSPDEPLPPYNLSLLIHSPVGKALKQIGLPLEKEAVLDTRKSATVSCTEPPPTQSCFPQKKTCLFNIAKDPCEYNNVADQYPEIVEELEKKLAEYRKGVVPPRNKPRDKRANPKYWGYAWSNWKDHDDRQIYL